MFNYIKVVLKSDLGIEQTRLSVVRVWYMQTWCPHVTVTQGRVRFWWC